MAEQIKRANFPTAWAGSWTSEVLRLNQGQSMYCYVSAPSFLAVVKADPLAYPVFSVSTWYYNPDAESWEGGGFRLASSYSHTLADDGESGLVTYCFYHNRDAEMVNATSSKKWKYGGDSPQSRKSSLMRFQVMNTSSAKQLLSVQTTIFYGGVGLMTDDEYNTYVRGKKICSNGTLIKGADGFVYFCGKLDDLSGAISKFNPENTRGTKITKDYAHHLVPYWGHIN